MIKYYQEDVLKIAYFIFESGNSRDRKVWVNDIRQQLSDLEMLESKTIMLSSILDLDRYRDDLTGINLWPKIRLGAVGLLLGTVKTFELALEKDLDYLLVFEDDFIIGDNFYNKLTTVMQEKEDFDLIALGYHINPEQAQDPNIPKDLIVPIEISKPWLAKTYSYVISKKQWKSFCHITTQMKSSQLTPCFLINCLN